MARHAMPVIAAALSAACMPFGNDSVAQTAPQDAVGFLKWSMDRHSYLRSYRAECAWSMGFGNMGAGPGSKRTIVYARPNRFKVVSSGPGGFVQVSVCDGKTLTEFSSMKDMGALKYGAPSSLASVTSMQMQHPMFCGSLLYKFFGGAKGLDGLVQLSKGPIAFGNSVTVGAIPCRSVKFYATGQFGHADVAIGKVDGLVRRIAYDSEPLMEMVKGQIKEQLKGQPATSLTTETYSKLVVNRIVPSSAFTATLPAGQKVQSMPAHAEQKPPVPLGRQAPDATVTSLTGMTTRLSSLRGKVVLIDFWATWCPPCRKGLPETLKLHQELVDKGLAVLAVSNEQKSVVGPFVAQNYPGLPAFLDASGKANRAYGVEAIPTVAVIDRSGRLSAYMVGLQSPETIREALNKAGLK
jgi:thiol-disulfide isomerase/thioredoxin